MQKVGAPKWHMIDEIDLVAMVADHAGLTRLCADLEAVADALPDRPSDEEAERLKFDLEHRMPTHEARESALLADVFDPATLSPLERALLEQIARQRAICVVQAQDLAAALHGDGAMPSWPSCGDTLGYMLRCFFNGCRQAMAFEELAILHIAGRRLTPAAAALLRGSLEARCGE